ncbi:putative peptidoglycan lipid II flippase [Caldanaerovirga acetigignens]|uniref:Probable lipid II flippase MurJ n=1 Tax=Caldanaerovirga acetigignens TaxID=447595 RepID=A0A1M7MNY9_9FIRM|nr:murein biosynthesis integral membrane protein MurJ [Caldanaerovirga acetigignens]SHM92629.1 putative peptidoglycan lipid II flippase [Caldanaerovirga acetigignens]
MPDKISYKKAAVVVMAITLLSKITGFLREIVLGSTYGATFITDAYLVSQTIPQVLFATVTAALATTYIPLYSKIKVERGEKVAVKFTNKVVNAVLAASAIVTLLGLIFTRPIVSFIAMGFEGETLRLAVSFTRIAFPMVLFIGLSNIFQGFLQSNGEFAIPAFIGIPYNFILIFAMIFLGSTRRYGLVIAALLGAFSQLLILLFGAAQKGYRFEKIFVLNDPDLIKVASLSVPVMMGTAVQQLNTMIDRMLASGLPEGSISALNFANRLNGFVYGLFSMSISVVIYPLLSRLKAEEDLAGFKDKLVRSISVIMLIILPITAGALVLSFPIVSLLFERGEFTRRATAMTASALVYYSLGMVFYGARDILNRAFYSLQDTRTPMVNGMITVGFNIVMNLILVRYMAHSGLALATSLSAALTTVLLIFNLWKKLGGLGGQRLAGVFAKSALSSAAMGLLVFLLYRNFAGYIESAGKLLGLAALGTIVGLGAIFYFALIYLLKVEEARWLFSTAKSSVKKFINFGLRVRAE